MSSIRTATAGNCRSRNEINHKEHIDWDFLQGRVSNPPYFVTFAFFAAKKSLDSRFHGNDAENDKPRQLYFFNTSRAITMRITSEAPSVIMRLR